MANAMGGAEEEVFETPDLAEDDMLEAGRSERSQETASLRAGNHKVQDAEVVAAAVPPQAAFEVFMGKTYAGAREDMSDAIGSSSTGFEGVVYAGDGYHRDGDAGAVNEGGEAGAAKDRALLRRTGESPLQRLVRLREETAMLAEDLEEMSKARSSRAEGDTPATGEGVEGEEGGGGEASGYALWSAMAKETEALKRQLAVLSGDPKFRHVVSPTQPTAGGDEALQQRLSDGVVRALEGLREAGGVGAAAAESKGAAVTEGEMSAADATTSSVTFELFLKEASEARARAGGVARGCGISGVEGRIAALEKALGGGDATGGRGGSSGLVKGEGAPLADTVASLEKRVSVLEPGRLEGLRQKAQLARAELDTLAKSRAALASSPSVGGVTRQKKVEEAFATLQTWQAVSAGLPALVDRLRALETLHLASASFAQRLEQVEVSQSELVGVLKTTNEGLEATRQSSAENVAIVEDNIRALDGRLAGVGIS